MEHRFNDDRFDRDKDRHDLAAVSGSIPARSRTLARRPINARSGANSRVRIPALLRILTLALMISPAAAIAQDYHAVNGSSEAGSLGVSNNPASIVNTPFAWDLTLFSAQATTATNTITIYNFAFLAPTRNSQWAFSNGSQSRFVAANLNMHLFNARIALDRQQAIAFGADLRSYLHAKSSPFNYNDSLHDLNNFFNVNNPNNVYSVHSASSSWLQLFGTYSRTLYDDGAHRLNAGVTLKYARAISGAYARLTNGAIQSHPRDAGDTSFYYTLKSADAQYGYSSNYDRWHNGQSTTQNLKDFLGNTQSGLGIDIGVEYLIKDGEPLTYSGRDAYYDYEWKIGVSLLDLGRKSYKYGYLSRSVGSPRAGVADSILDGKLDGIGSLAAFNDSLAGILSASAPQTGNFQLSDPTRLVINVDHYLGGDFFLNGELSLNLGPSDAGNKLGVQEISLLTVTPRWETHRWGVYLPVQYNALDQFLVGLALKGGPLLIGIHNVANLFGKSTTQNGGGYIALVIRSPHSISASRDKRFRQYDCPKN
ncbi:MAG: hypothetical protein P4L51_15290 [Puia sp.]|nr:hypothetical protein [Puia sp.]